MAATKNTATSAKPSEAVRQITYLASALKAPRITEAATRLAEQARDAGWTHEDYLAAVLEREVSARNASGAQLRIRAAGFAAVKTRTRHRQDPLDHLEDFDFEAQPAIDNKSPHWSEQHDVACVGQESSRGPPPEQDTECCSRPPPTGSPA